MKQMSRNISALAMGIGVVLLWAVCPMHAQLRLSAIADVNSEFPNDVLHDNVGFVMDQGKAAASLYVVFDLSQVPAGYRGSEIVAAVLETPSDASAGDIIFDVMLLGGPWDPNKLTYNSQPPFVKKLASRLALGGKTGVLQIDVTQQLRDWLDGTQPHYGVAFVPTSDSGSGGLTILPAGNSPAHAPIVIRPTYRSQAPDRVQSMISHVSQPIVAQSAASPRAGQSGQGQSQLPAVQRQPLTNADVIRMVKAGVPESTIVPAVQSSPTKFNLSPDALVELTRAGVTQKIMDAMMARGSGAFRPVRSRTAGRSRRTP